MAPGLEAIGIASKIGILYSLNCREQGKCSNANNSPRSGAMQQISAQIRGSREDEARPRAPWRCVIYEDSVYRFWAMGRPPSSRPA